MAPVQAQQHTSIKDAGNAWQEMVCMQRRHLRDARKLSQLKPCSAGEAA